MQGLSIYFQWIVYSEPGLIILTYLRSKVAKLHILKDFKIHFLFVLQKNISSQWQTLVFY